METKVIGLNKGIRRNPTIGQEGELLECENLVVKNGELVNAPRMVSTGKSANGKLWYVHKTSDGAEHYIDDGMLSRLGVSDVKEVTSVGNMLVIACADELRHALWKNNDYLLLPKEMPTLDVECGLTGKYNVYKYDVPVYYKKNEGEIGFDTLVCSKTDTIEPHGSGDAAAYTKIELKPIVEGDLFPPDYYKIEVTPQEVFFEAEIKYYVLGLYNEGEEIKYDYIIPFYKTDKAKFSTVFSTEKAYECIVIGIQPRLSAMGPVPASFYLYSGKSDSNTILVNDEEHDSFSSIKAAIFSFFRKYGNLKHRFINPFFVRCAYRLYDGSYVCHTSPCLLMPNTGKYPLVRPISVTPVSAVAWPGEIAVSGYAADLQMKIQSTGVDKVKWEDIITDVVIAISAPIYSYKEEVDKYILEAEMKLKDYDESDFDGVCQGYVDGTGNTRHRAYLKSDLETIFNQGANSRYGIDIPRHDSVTKQVENSSTFYIVKKIPYADVINGKYSSLAQMDFSDVSFDDITAYPVLSDESISLNRYVPNVMASYNSRLHIADYDKVFFRGHSAGTFSAYDNENGTKEYVYAVEVHEQSETVTVYSKKTSTSDALRWFFYPHNSAKKVTIYAKSDEVYEKAEIDLKSHPTLNGSYWFDNFRKIEFSAASSVPDAIASIFNGGSKDSSIHNSTNIMVSDVNSTYSFLYGGVVGTSANIKALSTATMAVEKDQHGKSPLICFVSDGIISIGQNAEGKYINNQYVARNVLCDGTKPLQLDHAIIFVTNEGLYAMTDGSLPKNISKNLEGRTKDEDSFVSMLPSSMMLWDSDNGYVHVFVENATYHYIYNVESGEWSKSGEGYPQTVVPGYPRSLVQKKDDSLWQYKKSEDATKHYPGHLLTKEVAFDNAFAYKILMDLRVMRKEEYYVIGSGAKVRTAKVKVWVSNDRVHWAVLPSLKMRSFKWYRFEINTDMSDVDGLEGIACKVDERYGGKMR